MNPYSHLVIASKIEALVHPENAPEYYWGAIAPDIRYLAAMPRKQTHLPSQRIVGLISQYPYLKSFLQGYLVHCLTDEIELEGVFFKHFPFSILKNKMSRQQLAVILELYYFETERISQRLSDVHNEVLTELGLREAQSARLSQSISQYAMSSSFESRITDLARLLGLENDSRIANYRIAAKRFQKNWLLKNGLLFGIKAGNISERIVFTVTSLYQQCNV
jgi:hypothetical protein